MAAINSQITALLQMGADAMDNLYEVYIDLPSQIEGQFGTDGAGPNGTTQLKVRATGFTPPKFAQDLYEVRYKTVGVKRPASKITGDREFKITFRLDAHYNVYKALLKWRSLSFVPETGFATNQIEDLNVETEDTSRSKMGKVRVRALASPLSQNNTWRDDQGIASTAENAGEIPENQAMLWNYHQVWCSDVDEPVYKQGAGAAMEISATFQFGEFDTPLVNNVDVSNTA